jgi:carbamoyl-phosphate synthase large subunit
VNEGRPNIVDLVKTGKVDLVINTPLGRESFYDEKSIRRAAVRYNVPCITTLSAAIAASRGILAMSVESPDIAALQDLPSNEDAGGGHGCPAISATHRRGLIVDCGRISL